METAKIEIRPNSLQALKQIMEKNYKKGDSSTLIFLIAIKQMNTWDLPTSPDELKKL